MSRGQLRSPTASFGSFAASAPPPAFSPRSGCSGGWHDGRRALCRDRGSYYGLPGVDPWDEARDARLYAGPHPVVAHPPCQRWGKFWAGQPLWIARTGERKVKGDDGAVSPMRSRWFGNGGVLEHPWGSHAWPHFGLTVPPRDGGWVQADGFLGWTCCVEQGRYGHYARKPTLLYAVGTDLPSLRWGKSEPQFPPGPSRKYGLAYCKRAGELAFKGGGKDSHHRIGTRPNSATCYSAWPPLCEGRSMTLPIPARPGNPRPPPCLAPTRAQLAPGSRAGALFGVRMSALEAFCNAAIGLLISWAVTFFLLPLWGLTPSAGQSAGHHLGISGSALRDPYVLRRAFAKWAS